MHTQVLAEAGQAVPSFLGELARKRPADAGARKRPAATRGHGTDRQGGGRRRGTRSDSEWGLDEWGSRKRARSGAAPTHTHLFE